MRTPRILVTRRWPEEVERVLSARFDTTLNESDRPLTEKEFFSAMKNYDAILPTVSDKLPAGLFEGPGLRAKIFGNFGVGFNHIDIAAARSAGIVVTNTPGVLTDATADIALTLMLMTARRAGEGERQLRAGEWKGWCPTHMLGRELSGKTLGIIGMGRIGKATARRAHFGFGMKIVFSNRSAVEDDETRAMKAEQLKSIDDVMGASDFVSLHCPGGGENRHLVDARRLGLMKPDAYLINTARGDVIDTAALVEALRSRTIAGAGLDVYEGEPSIPAGLVDLENATLLPHLGSATAETRVAMGMKVVENITAFFDGRDPPDRVTPAGGAAALQRVVGRSDMDCEGPRRFLAALFEAAVRAADPCEAMRGRLPDMPKGRTVVIGAGKAASQMAAAFETLWDGPLQGVVVVPRGASTPTKGIRVLEASHPIPDSSSLAAANALFEAVAGLTRDDLVVSLISGGGSALLAAPNGALTLDDEIAVHRTLLASGAPISAMNIVRKHISRIKGGGLARAVGPARLVNFIVSDVPADDPALVASGPTVLDNSTARDALAIIAHYNLCLPKPVVSFLNRKAEEAVIEELSDAQAIETHIIASSTLAMERAALQASRLGMPAIILSGAIEGEASDIGRMHAAIAKEVALRGRPFTPPVVILSGGETTVTLQTENLGRGGRNSEFLLSFAIDIEGVPGIHALAADTDGIDGTGQNAGAFADCNTAGIVRKVAGDPRSFLARHDSWSAFDAAQSLFMTGPTGTNVNDFRAVVILDSAGLWPGDSGRSDQLWTRCLVS